MKVLCLLPAMSDARIARRIDMLKRAGFEVRAAGFERHHAFGRQPDCPLVRLGKLPPKRYLSRLARLLWAAPRVRAAMQESDIVYAFNPDLALLAVVAGAGRNRPLALDVADIKAVQVAKGWLGGAVRAVEKRAVRGCRLLTLTTEGYRGYYRDWLGSDVRIVVLENKLDPEFVQSTLAHPPAAPEKGLVAGGPLRIGWFGRLRDEWTLRVLERLTERCGGGFAAVLAGTPSPFLKGFSGRVAGNAHLDYRGGYRHPEDLPELYGSVDVAMACYPPEIPHGWSQSNRFYEACLFRTPLVVRAGCADAQPVRERDVGLVIDAKGAEAAAAAVAGISREDLYRWRRNAAALPVALFSAADEPEVLRGHLGDIAEPRAALPSATVRGE